MLSMLFIRLDLEFNELPSMAIFDDPSRGVSSELTPTLPQQPQYNKATIQDMMDSPIYSRMDRLDKIAAAQSALAEKMTIYKQSGFHTQFIKNLQKR